VKETGVTCYTCHRGNHIPKNVWFKSPEQAGGHMLGNLNGQNNPMESTAYTSMPNEPYSRYILENHPARIQGDTGLPTGNKHTIQETETVYSFMNHLSKSLGVNCTYCHNSRAFSDWNQSRPQSSAGVACNTNVKRC
jgi:photosynthetic reaction center cytochrome c subunit